MLLGFGFWVWGFWGKGKFCVGLNIKGVMTDMTGFRRVTDGFPTCLVYLTRYGVYTHTYIYIHVDIEMRYI